MDPQLPDDKNNQYGLPTQKGRVVQPLPGQLSSDDTNPAADLIRHKLSDIYGDEPSAAEESAEAQILTRRSKHQQFMFDLSHSGKSLAEIQTDWHNYYVDLPDNEKHQVWQEFYTTHNQIRYPSTEQPNPDVEQHQKPATAHKRRTLAKPKEDGRTVSDVKSQLLSKIQTSGKLKKSDHLRSLLFGLTLGFLVMVIMMFGFFNERFIAPFMTPSRSVSSTPLTIDPSTTAVGKDPKIIIPKINLEIPVVYTVDSITEADMQKGLEKGVVHYATTVNPGELGNGAIFGHSSNNLFNRGDFKYAFVLLGKLSINDTFFLEKDGKRYVYKVYEKKIVPPTAVEILNTQDKPATFTLVTCDPPGRNVNRMVIVGEQISPDPVKNAVSTVKNDVKPAELPSNSPTLWSRFWKWVSG